MEKRQNNISGRTHTFRGYAAVFNTLSADLGGFVERIAPGAFAKALKSGDDVRALIDHDHSRILGRTDALSLELREDCYGLWFRVVAQPTSYADDLALLVSSEDVNGCSFGFRVFDGGETWDFSGPVPIRTLTAIDLREITITSIPAYDMTEVSLKADPAVRARPVKKDGCPPWVPYVLQMLAIPARPRI